MLGIVLRGEDAFMIPFLLLWSGGELDSESLRSTNIWGMVGSTLALIILRLFPGASGSEDFRVRDTAISPAMRRHPPT